MAQNQNSQPAQGASPAQQQPERERGMVIYSVAGQEVKLSTAIVKNYLTKGNGAISEQEIIQFISICKYNSLNPFLGEAYLVKYGTDPATMIVAKEAFFKRADACENYEGIESGIIVQRGEEFVELEGTFKRPNDILVGGWAKVHRSDKKFVFVSRVNLDEYIQVKRDGTPNRFWNEKPSTMICKVAKMQALREAFPSQLGAMYTQEESRIVDSEYEDIKREVAIEGAGRKLISPNDSGFLSANPKPETASPAQKDSPEIRPSEEKIESDPY